MNNIVFFLVIGVCEAQYGTYTNSYYLYDTVATNKLNNCEARLDEIEEKLSMGFDRQLSALRDRVDDLEIELDQLKRSVTYDWKKTDSGSFYKLFLEKKSFDDAKRICKWFGAQLATVDTEYKNDYIKDMLKVALNETESEPEIWFGAKRKATMLSPLKSSYSNFDEDQPVEGCTAMNSDGKWLLKKCSELKAFICQQTFVR